MAQGGSGGETGSAGGLASPQFCRQTGTHPGSSPSLPSTGGKGAVSNTKAEFFLRHIPILESAVNKLLLAIIPLVPTHGVTQIS